MLFHFLQIGDEFRELCQRICRASKFRMLCCMRNNVKHRRVVQFRQHRSRFNGFVANFTCRYIDDAAQAQIICRIGNDPQIRQHVFYFCAVKESQTADNAIWHTVSLECALNAVGQHMIAI